MVCADGRRCLLWDADEDFQMELKYDFLRLSLGIKAKKLKVRIRKVVKKREKRTKEAISVIETDLYPLVSVPFWLVLRFSYGKDCVRA